MKSAHSLHWFMVYFLSSGAVMVGLSGSGAAVQRGASVGIGVAGLAAVVTALAVNYLGCGGGGSARSGLSAERLLQ